VHALFQQRVAGDEALLRLAQLRFEQAGLAAEVHAGTPDELDRLLGFTPREAPPPVVHLDRRLDILRQPDRDAVAGLARRFAGRVAGFVVHDRADMPTRLDDLVAAAAEVDAALASLGPPPPRLYLEYAAGCELGEFVEMGWRLRDFERVSLCVDTGHVGVREARRQFARQHPGLGFDLADLEPGDPRLPELAADVQAAVASALPAVLHLAGTLAALDKPLHFHLHDGHPLVPGLADHFSFLTRLPVPFWYAGRESLSPLYGPSGVDEIVRSAVEACTAVSFTLEIHQVEGRLPLGDAAGLFRHWSDTTNAERMNYVLAVLSENALLVTAALGQ